MKQTEYRRIGEGGRILTLLIQRKCYLHNVEEEKVPSGGTRKGPKLPRVLNGAPRLGRRKRDHGGVKKKENEKKSLVNLLP